MPGIPDKWGVYTAMGGIVGNTKFIPFKVPLKSTLCNKLPEMERFTPSHLLSMVGKLGLVIDLTNTRRYYNPEDLISSGVQYVKIFCQGHGSIPNVEIVRRFYGAVQQFLYENKDGLIGVHCTHGLNRTGYLICRYMIENLGYSAKDAIKEFNKARGHDIERSEYVRDLYKVEASYLNTPSKYVECISKGKHDAHFSKPRYEKYKFKPNSRRIGEQSYQQSNYMSRHHQRDDSSWNQYDKSYELHVDNRYFRPPQRYNYVNGDGENRHNN